MADGSASPASHALRREIDALETLCEAMADWLDQTGFDLDRRQLVELRRRLTNQIIEIGRIGELHFAASPADANGFRVRLSALRAWTAAHQAAWPAVWIEPHSAADYRRSAAVVQQAASDLLSWLRAAADARI